MSETEPPFSAAALDGLEVDKERPFFDTGLTKLVLLSVASFGLYQIYWFYRHWRVLRDRSGDDVIPILRAIFGGLFCGALASRVRQKLIYHDLETTLRPGFLWAAYVLLNIAWKLPTPYWLVSSLSFLPLVAIQKEINRLHERLGFPVENRRLGVGGWLIMVLGGLWWLLVLLGLLVMEVEA